MASNAPVDANVAIDARPAVKRGASSTEDDVGPGGADIAGMAKRRRTIATVKMEPMDAVLVGHIDAHAPAPAAGGDGKRPRPATRTPARTRATRAIRAGIPSAKQTTGFEGRARLLDLNVPATSLPLPTPGTLAFPMLLNLDLPGTALPLNLDRHATALRQSAAGPLESGAPYARAHPLYAPATSPLPTQANPAFPQLLNLDLPGTALPLNLDLPAAAPPQSAAGPLERGTLYARADPLYANVDPMLVAAYERSRPRMPLDETRHFSAVWATYGLPAPLELSGTDLSVLRPYGVTADGDAALARGYLHAREDADRKSRVPPGLGPTGALDGREALVSAPLRLGDHMPTYDVANLDPALWGEERRPYIPLDEQRAATDAPLGLGARMSADDLANLDSALWDVPLEDKRAATDAPLDLQATNAHAPHADNIAQLLAPAHADAPEDERTPYVPFHEKLDYITEWRRRVAADAPAPLELPAPLEVPAPDAVVPGAYYRADGVGIPVGDPRTRDWVPLPPYDAALDELAQYGAAPNEMPPMSPKTKRELEEFLAAGPGPFADDTPTGPRARVDMGLLTPEEGVLTLLDAARNLALLDALLLDLQS